jgi:hypothetical protein
VQLRFHSRKTKCVANTGEWLVSAEHHNTTVKAFALGADNARMWFSRFESVA